jgi:hypothetical protein
MAAAASRSEKPLLSHNLDGQRLGKKGRGTRERVLAATERLLAAPVDTGISLSAVAREASLGMTTLYLYFSDLTELLLAVLEPIMASAETSYVGHLWRRTVLSSSNPITPSGSATRASCTCATASPTPTMRGCGSIVLRFHSR